MDPRIGDWYPRYAPLVFRRALQLMGSESAATDITQEVFIRAARNIGRFDTRAKPSTWLYRITTNLCLNRLRDSGRRRELLAQNAAEVTPGSVPHDVEKMASMRRLLARADPQQADAAVAVFVDGMTHAEAAEHMEVSRRTVGNLIERFTRWARAELDEE